MKYTLALLVALCTAAAVAQDAMPSGASVLDRYLEVTGGRAAYEKRQTEIRTGAMEMTAKGLRFTSTIYRAAPNKSYMVMEMSGVGKIEEGTDGVVAWSNSSMRGPQVKQGEEKALALQAAKFHCDARWRESLKSVETVGVEDVGGQSSYKLEVVTNDGLRQTRYYDKKTGLLLKSVMTVKTQMGEIPTESMVSDYRDVDGVLMPHKTTTKLMGQEMVVTTDSVKTNVKIDKDRFTPPAGVKALLAKAK